MENQRGNREKGTTILMMATGEGRSWGSRLFWSRTVYSVEELECRNGWISSQPARMSRYPCGDTVTDGKTMCRTTSGLKKSIRWYIVDYIRRCQNTDLGMHWRNCS